MIAGLIPAAGHSRRMGCPKLALPVAGRTVLEQVVAALHQAGVAPVLVVLGPHVATLAPLAESAGAHVLSLPAPTPDMRATVEQGLTWLEARCHPAPEDAWLLVPADHPTLDAQVIATLCAARQEHPERSIIVPTWQGQRGHPTLITFAHTQGIRQHPAGEGLNTYLRRQTEGTLELPVHSPAVIADLDTPEDYEQLLQTLAQHDPGATLTESPSPPR